MSQVQCNFCKAPIGNNSFIQLVNETYIQYCSRCNEHLYKCATCANRPSPCAFAADPSPLPQYIQKVTQINNMRQIQTIPNPERQAITCAKCLCYQENECKIAEYQINPICPNYQIAISP
jgi:hypothetical protein